VAAGHEEDAGIDTGGPVELDNLAAELAASGLNDAITVQTKAGNLMLSAGNTLMAAKILTVSFHCSGVALPTNFARLTHIRNLVASIWPGLWTMRRSAR